MSKKICVVCGKVFDGKCNAVMQDFVQKNAGILLSIPMNLIIKNLGN
jgi:hypothetical protein